MILPPDPFAKSFDSIEIDRAPSPAAIESAFAAIAPTAAAPEHGQSGYFLLDDAGGRFTVDREMGVVMLRDETLLTREHGAVYPARLRVVEPSGASYDLNLQLRITGRVPQVVGAEDFGLGSDAIATPVQTSAPHVAWTGFAPALGAQTKPTLATTGAYGALFSVTLPASNARVMTSLNETIPAPAPAHAIWPL